MRHVGDRVFELRRGQRPARPVGEAVRLVERVAGDALHQLVVGDEVAIAEHHGGDLRVEHRMRNDLGAMPDDLDVLARRVKDLQHLLVRHQLEERRKVEPFGQRVDHHGLVGARHLRHAQDGKIGGLAQKLGVHGDEGVLRQPAAHGRQFLRGRDRLHPGLLTGVGQRCRGARAAFFFPCRRAWAGIGSITKGSNVVRYLIVIAALLMSAVYACGRPRSRTRPAAA